MLQKCSFQLGALFSGRSRAPAPHLRIHHEKRACGTMRRHQQAFGKGMRPRPETEIDGFTPLLVFIEETPNPKKNIGSQKPIFWISSLSRVSVRDLSSQWVLQGSFRFCTVFRFPPHESLVVRAVTADPNGITTQPFFAFLCLSS